MGFFFGLPHLSQNFWCLAVRYPQSHFQNISIFTSGLVSVLIVMIILSITSYSDVSMSRITDEVRDPMVPYLILMSDIRPTYRYAVFTTAYDMTLLHPSPEMLISLGAGV